MILVRFFLFTFIFQLAFFASENTLPTKYMVSQQLGSTCFLSCWDNHKLVQKMRNEEGFLLDESGKFFCKGQEKNRFEWFLETANSYCEWYKLFSEAKGCEHFSKFIQRVRENSIRVEDASLDGLDPTEVTVKHYFPHLLSKNQDALDINRLYIPKPLKDLSVPFSFSDLSFAEGSNIIWIKKLGHSIPFVDHAMFDEEQVFYNFGLYKLMLMALKVTKNNDIVTEYDIDEESMEILEFHKIMNSIDNPWKAIDPEYFLEFRIARLFKDDTSIKNDAPSVVDVFFKSFGFYKEASDNLKLKQKMQDLPGKEQMLSYCFCQSLRKIYAACISENAFSTVLEIDQSAPIEDWRQMFVESYRRKSESGKSYQDVWNNIKKKLQIVDNMDFVTFDGHGAVLSFDTRALGAQKFQYRDTAQDLGFVVIDSGYASGMKPFYMFEGSLNPQTFLKDTNCQQ